MYLFSVPSRVSNIREIHSLLHSQLIFEKANVSTNWSCSKTMRWSCTGLYETQKGFWWWGGRRSTNYIIISAMQCMVLTLQMLRNFIEEGVGGLWYLVHTRVYMAFKRASCAPNFILRKKVLHTCRRTDKQPQTAFQINQFHYYLHWADLGDMDVVGVFGIFWGVLCIIYSPV